MAGRPAYKPTDEHRERVETLGAYGVQNEAIAKLLRISPNTLVKHFSRELDDASTLANAKVAGFLFENARAGNVTAQIFWLKCRARWKEPASAHEITGLNGGPLEIVHALLEDIDQRQRGPVIEHQASGEKD